MEALTVVGVLSILFALLLPMIARAREGARRAQCRANFLAIGTALQAYHAAHRVFPPGIANHELPKCLGDDWPDRAGAISAFDFVARNATCDDPEAPSFSGLLLLLPHLERRGVFDSYNLALACCALQNGTAVSRPVREYLCPSTPPRAAIDWGYFLAPPALVGAPGPAQTDYVFSHGALGVFTYKSPFALTMAQYARAIPQSHRYASGPFGVNRATYIGTLRDGASQSILMGESFGGLPAGTSDAEGAAIVPGDQAMKGHHRDQRCDQAWAQAFIGARSGHGGFGSVLGAAAFNAWYDWQPSRWADPAGSPGWFPYPLNESRNAFGRPTWAASSQPELSLSNIWALGPQYTGTLGSCQGFRSSHYGGVHFLLGDGSVRFFPDAIDPKVLAAYATIIGRDSIEERP
jgi:hypothetical protein